MNTVSDERAGIAHSPIYIAHLIKMFGCNVKNIPLAGLKHAKQQGPCTLTTAEGQQCSKFVRQLHQLQPQSQTRESKFTSKCKLYKDNNSYHQLNF